MIGAHDLTRIFIAVTAHCLVLSTSQAAPVAPSTEQLIRLGEAFAIAERLGPVVWPGFSVAESPVVLIEGELEFLLNSASPAPGFEVLPQIHFRERPVFSRKRNFPPGLEASFPAIGREAVVIGTPEATGRKPANWILIVTHELFHVYEAARGLQSKVESLQISDDDSGQWQLSFPFPYEDERVVRAMHLTGHELYRLLESDTDSSYRATVAAEGLRNLTTLLQLAFPEEKNVSYLKFVTTKEGAARFFEYRMAEAAASNYQPSEELSRLDGGDLFQRVWANYYSSLPLQIKHLGRVSRSRTEFYNLGLALALVLDQLDSDWKAQFHDPNLWLDDIFTSRASGGSCPTG